MTHFVLEIPGEPVPKLRARSGRDGRWYTPRKAVAAQEAIAKEADLAHRKPLLTGPIRLVMHFTFAPPKSWSRKNRAAAFEGEIPHTVKPDLDNLIKLVKDALSKIVYHDDKQIVELEAFKSYGNPSTTITVRELMPLRAAA